MEPVYELNGLRIVDLTKVLDPKTESRRCHLIRYNTGGPIPDFHTALDLTSHLGTHCECPYHHFEDGKSVGELPLTTFMGRAIYVNIDFLEPNSHISAADLDRACGDRSGWQQNGWRCWFDEVCAVWQLYVAAQQLL